jgi:glycosyltransferase involved in cell wall biosynthesis
MGADPLERRAIGMEDRESGIVMSQTSALPRQMVIIEWPLSSLYGWGVYGLNLALQWANDPDIQPIGSFPVDRDSILLDRLRLGMLDDFFRESKRLQERMKGFETSEVKINAPVLHPLSNYFELPSGKFQKLLDGTPNIGIIFFEDTRLDRNMVASAKRFSLIVAGSRWNEQILREYGIDHVTTVIQGVDLTLFHPAPRSGFFEGKFLVFSGGKLEFRKGQDLALLAFRAFASRHPEAMLVTAWHSPWPALAKSIETNRNVKPVVFTEQGKVDTKGWAAANGIPPDKVIDLGEVPNALMPSILRDMDVGLFPNRGEGGTNLVAMECMACGTATILSRNTGHLDLIADGNVIPLVRQTALGGIGAGVGGTAGWGESDVDEAVEALETVWRNRDQARDLGLRAAKQMQGLSWANQTMELKKAIMPLMPERP